MYFGKTLFNPLTLSNSLFCCVSIYVITWVTIIGGFFVYGFLTFFFFAVQNTGILDSRDLDLNLVAHE